MDLKEMIARYGAENLRLMGIGMEPFVVKIPEEHEFESIQKDLDNGLVKLYVDCVQSDEIINELDGIISELKGMS